VKKDKKPKEDTQSDNKVLKTCIICGKSVDKFVVNPSYPEKSICLICLNGYLANPNTIQEEFIPLADALSKAASELKERLDKGSV
jgi:hypothetical protein